MSTMDAVIVILDWHFSPPDFFEETITISRNDYTMVIENGKVEARTTAAAYDANASMRNELHEALNDRFRGGQLLSHMAYELSKPRVTKLHPDGHKDIFMELEGAQLKLTGGTVDFQVTDQHGNVVSDSRRDRIEKKKNLAELVSAYRSSDAVLSALLKSCGAAVRDPDNELVHLYEIREALCKRFGNEHAARSALGVSSSWSRFRQLCNDEALRQGRHRGKNVGGLRDATDAELMEARGIARSMIESYLQHLDNPKGAGP
jgi:hypothetical protein